MEKHFQKYKVKFAVLETKQFSKIEFRARPRQLLESAPAKIDEGGEGEGGKFAQVKKIW